MVNKVLKMVLIGLISFGYVGGVSADSGTSARVSDPGIVHAESSSEMIVWAQRAALAMFTYDYKNYPQQLVDVKKYFTEDGWKSYLKAIAKRDVKDLTEKQLAVSAVVDGKSSIVSDRMVNGSPVMDNKKGVDINVPLLVSHRGKVGHTHQLLSVKMQVKCITTDSLTVGKVGSHTFAINHITITSVK